MTNATKLLISGGLNGLASGHNYVFQTRVKALCGFGAVSLAFGYYPPNGKFFIGSLAVPCEVVETRLPKQELFKVQNMRHLEIHV